MDNKEINTIEEIKEAIEYASLDLPNRMGILDKARLAMLKLRASGVLISPTFDAIKAQIMKLLFTAQEARLTNSIFLIDKFYLVFVHDLQPVFSNLHAFYDK